MHNYVCTNDSKVGIRYIIMYVPMILRWVLDT